MTRDWRNDAACLGRAPEFDAYIDGESSAEQTARLIASASICKTECTVRAECRRDYVKGVDFGVRFGEVFGLPRGAIAGNGNGHIKGSQARKANNHDTEGNRAELIADLTRMGLSAREIAERLNVSARLVTRYRAAGRGAA